MDSTHTQIMSFTFGDFIKGARKARDMTQLEVSTAAGIEQAYLSKIERGVREPTLSVAIRICDALSLDINDFVHRNK